jgi:uncharacterized membrane protein HdeD (DUF308 family)
MTANSSSPHSHLSQSRGWLIFAGIFSIFVGFFAIGSPYLFTAVITTFLGAFALASGVVSLGLAIFSKHVTHRVIEAILAIIRIAAGIVILRCLASGVAVITLIIAVFFIVEGVSFIIGALKMRSHGGWVWMLISGLASLILGVMIYARWPSDSWQIIGLLYGIQSLFWGVSMLSLGFAAKPQNA